MKTNWKKLIIIPLLLAVAVAPVCAQNNPGADNGSNNPPAAPTAPIAPLAPPDPAALPAPANQTAATNADDGRQKKHDKHEEDSDSTPVRIDATGVHIGGKDPVDINVPGMSESATSKTSDWAPPGLRETIPIGAVLISVVAITMPFIFLTVAIGCWVFFKYRRNRMLHETLRAMIDKGVPIPPELIMPPAQQIRRRTNSDLRNGLIMLGLGIGILLFHLRLGWIPIFIGVAFLITWLIEKKQNSKDGQINN
jgi:hypothetical protein